MKDFDNYKSELDKLYLEEQISKCNYELNIDTVYKKRYII